MFDQVTRAPRLPRPGETLFGSHYHTGFGGKGANQAVASARLGAQVTLVAKLGNDAIARATVEHYKEEGIGIDFLCFDAEHPSGVAPIWVDEQTGQNSILVVPGANQTLTPLEVRRAQEAIRASHVLLCQMETPISCTLEAFRIARSEGAATCTLLNPAPCSPIPEELYPLIDILAPNESEAAALSGMPVVSRDQAFAAALCLKERGVGTVIVTLGAQGAVAVTDQDQRISVSAPVVKAVDTTGAGDCFIGSLAVFMSLGLPLRRAMENACITASRSVMSQGTQSAYPRRRDLDPLLFSIEP